MKNKVLSTLIIFIFIKNSQSTNDTKSITTQCSYGYNGDNSDGNNLNN